MTMNIDDPARLNGTTVIGGDGEKLGSVDAVYYDNATDRAEWVAVRSGLFGTRVALVPLRRANYSGDALRVPFDKVQLKNAPHHDPGRELSASDEADLYRYYGIDHGRSADDSARTDELAGDMLHGWDRAGRTDGAEQRTRVGTTSEEAGRARLRKHIVTAEPVERIRPAREAVTEQRTVEGDVRREHLDFGRPDPRNVELVDTDTIERDEHDRRHL